MRRVVLFMHISLDGFVAGSGGEMDWIHVDEEIFDYAARRTNEADTALYGRITYQMMEAYWPTAAEQPNPSRHDIEHSRWYNAVDKVVASRTMKDLNRPGLKLIGKNLVDEIKKLKQVQGREIVMFGSPGLAHSLMTENLIDNYWLFVNPILLGRGIPLFTELQGRKALKLIESHVFSSGVVCLHYESNNGS